MVGRGRLADLDDRRSDGWRSVFWLLKAPRVKYWETIADNLKKRGWKCGCISSTDYGPQFWVVAAERSDAGRFIVRADEKLTAFLELESTIRKV